MILSEIPDFSAITVEVTNPETPFGGVQVFGVSDSVIQLEFGVGGIDPIPGAGGGEGPSTDLEFTDNFSVVDGVVDLADLIHVQQVMIGSKARLTATPTGVLLEYFVDPDWLPAQSWP